VLSENVTILQHEIMVPNFKVIGSPACPSIDLTNCELKTPAVQRKFLSQIFCWRIVGTVDSQVDDQAVITTLLTMGFALSGDICKRRCNQLLSMRGL
jgi:hypothetical protein